MLVIITTDSYYSYWEDEWEGINSIPEGQIYHRIHSNIDGTDHFFSDKPITDQQIEDNYN